jgi:hypothetical protein
MKMKECEHTWLITDSSYVIYSGILYEGIEEMCTECNETITFLREIEKNDIDDIMQNQRVYDNDKLRYIN